MWAVEIGHHLSSFEPFASGCTNPLLGVKYRFGTYLFEILAEIFGASHSADTGHGIVADLVTGNLLTWASSREYHSPWASDNRRYGQFDHDDNRLGFASRFYRFFTSSTARNILGKRAFFIARKEKHGFELAIAFEEWLKEEAKYSERYDSVDLTVIHVNMSLRVEPTHQTTMSGEVIARERTYGDYAFQHIITGYPEIYNSWHNLTNTVSMYADWAKLEFPKIKQDLATIIHRLLPDLPFTPSEREDYCDLDVLLTKFIECKLGYDTLDFLRHEPSAFEKAIGQAHLYVTAHDNKRRLLMRTRAWMDFRVFAEVIPSIFMDKTIQEELDAVSNRVSMIRSDLENFKVGLRDLVNGLKLGGRLIEGDCANCKGLETRLLSS